MSSHYTQRMKDAAIKMWKVRLLRAWCYLFHWRGQVRHNGFGWHGWRCTKCGWMFFSHWTEHVSSFPEHNE